VYDSRAQNFQQPRARNSCTATTSSSGTILAAIQRLYSARRRQTSAAARHSTGALATSNVSDAAGRAGRGAVCARRASTSRRSGQNRHRWSRRRHLQTRSTSSGNNSLVDGSCKHRATHLLTLSLRIMIVNVDDTCRSIACSKAA
jgi:hypothetical protein